MISMDEQVQNKTVLYVEDEENDAFLIRRAFRVAGITVNLEAVSDGDEAIAYLQGKAPYERSSCPVPRMVILDLNLPRKSGFEVLEWMRQQPEYADIPVIVFTSSNHSMDKERADNLGATDFAVKPTTPNGSVDFVISIRKYL